MKETIRIFIGCSANGEDAEAQAMLEYTIRKYSTSPVEITWMKISHDPSSVWYSNPEKNEGWNTTKWSTPFSGLRWGVAHACNYQGKAIYLDVDMILLDDITKLWEQKFDAGIAILSKDLAHNSVMLLHCEKLKSLLPEFEKLRTTENQFRAIRYNTTKTTAKFTGNWNCLDGEAYESLTDPDIKILHFTRIFTQPHLKYAFPRLQAQGLKHWNKFSAPVPHKRKDVEPFIDKLWKEAQEAGYTVEKYLN